MSKTSSPLAHSLVGLVTVGGSAMLSYAFSQHGSPDWFRLVAFLLIASVASRLKLKLPGLTGNMSANLPFLLIAFAQLGMTEAIAVTCFSTLVQSMPREASKLQPMHVIFNVSNMAIAAGAAYLVYHLGGDMPAPMRSSVMLVFATVAFFASSTVLVAAIISLTEGQNFGKVWAGIFIWSFAYYVMSAGVASVAITATPFVGWLTPLVLLPVMYFVYRSYRVYFGIKAIEPVLKLTEEVKEEELIAV